MGTTGGGVWVHNSCGSNSKKLGDALTTDGEPNPEPGTRKWAAHHLVESGKDEADGSRRLLEAYGVPINSKVNGVWLPNGAKNAVLGPIQYTTHQNFPASYAEAVQEYLVLKTQGIDRTNTPAMKDALTKVLGDIKLKLQTGNGPFPWSM